MIGVFCGGIKNGETLEKSLKILISFIHSGYNSQEKTVPSFSTQVGFSQKVVVQISVHLSEQHSAFSSAFEGADSYVPRLWKIFGDSWWQGIFKLWK